MTQEEKFVARLKTLGNGMHEIVVYITPQGTLGFWVVENSIKVEGEQKIGINPGLIPKEVEST